MEKLKLNIKRIKELISAFVLALVLLIIISSIFLFINQKRQLREYDNIEKNKQKIIVYEAKVDSLITLYQSKQLIIDSLEVENIKLSTILSKLEEIKKIEKDGTVVKIQAIDNFSVNELDSFFSDRYNKIP